jgi:MFS family permease
MLFFFMLINFADKAVLGLSAGPILHELKLTHAQFGQLGSSFFLLFSASAVAVGFLINRVSTKWTLAVMALVWALVQLPMLFAVGLPMLIANRVILGAGEGPAFPMALHSIYKWFPDERRPLPTSLIALGGAVGTGIAAPTITYVILRYSWHAAFGLLGVLGAVWVLVWILVGREGPILNSAAQDAPPAAPIPYGRLLTCRTILGNMLLGFSAYWMLTLAVVWLPEYLRVGAGFSVAKVGWIVTLPSLCQILAVPALSAWSERLKRRGVSSRVCRGLIGASSVGLAGALLFLLPFTTGPVLPILCTALAFSCGTTIFTMGAVLVAEVTPAGQRGAALGINNAVATLAGVFAPVTMGMIVDVGATSAEGFRHGFMLVGACVVVAAIVGGLLIDPEADTRRLSRGETKLGAGPAPATPLGKATSL